MLSEQLVALRMQGVGVTSSSQTEFMQQISENTVPL